MNTRKHCSWCWDDCRQTTRSQSVSSPTANCKKVTFGAIIWHKFSTLTFWPCERFGTILTVPKVPWNSTDAAGDLASRRIEWRRDGFCVNDASQPIRTDYGAIDGGATSCHVGGSAVDVRSPHCLPRGAYLHVSVPQETTDGVQTPPPPQWESTPAVWVARDLRGRMGRCLVAHCYTPTQVEQTRFRLATAPHSGKYSTCGSVVVRSPASGHTANNKYVRKEEKCCPM